MKSKYRTIMRSSVGTFATNLALLCFLSPATAETPLPVIDVHMHAMGVGDEGPSPTAMCTPMNWPAWDPAVPYPEAFIGALKNPQCDDPVWSPTEQDELRDRTLAEIERFNVYGVMDGTPERLAEWMEAAPNRFIPGINLRLGTDRAYPIEMLRELHEEGRLGALAEVSNQYEGIEPDDPRMDPYWALAEELDIPVGIHIGTGPPGVIYLGSRNYRARMHSPLALEEILVRHPTLRIYVMHAGYPMLDDTLALMYAHPQVHVEVGIIVYSVPREGFYRYLESIVDAGYGKRILFGSDHMVWPETIGRSIKVIEEAEFLTEEQKRDILYNNAARFLRLSDEEIARHHGN